MIPWYALSAVILAGIFINVEAQAINLIPKWEASSIKNLTVGIREDTPVGTSITTLLCTDPENDRILYSVISGKAVAVNPITGVVTLASKLDFEVKDRIEYSITFACIDTDEEGFERNHPQQLIDGSFSVNDFNDEYPTFSVDNKEGYSFFIREDAAIGDLVTDQITVTDADKSTNARLDTMYLICNSPFPGDYPDLPESSVATCEKFELQQTLLSEGKYQASIFIKAHLDYELRRVYSSKLIAIDGPGLDVKLSSTTNININIIDAQDRPPEFVDPVRNENIPEDTPVGTTVQYSVSARDGDLGDKRPITLELIDDPDDKFDLSPPVEDSATGIWTSQIVIRNPLDREATESSTYQFTVLATELDKDTLQKTTDTAQATYTLFVTDVNDNGPEFDQQNYEVNVSETTLSSGSSSVQIPFLHLICNDRDEPSNARYSVNIVKQPYDVYSVTPGNIFTGEANLFLKLSDSSYMDYDVPAYRTQIIELEAKELGTQLPRSSSCTVTINLIDVNDNSPQFDQLSYTARIREDVNEFPYKVIQIQAVDKDDGNNGQVKYYLDSDKFSIDENSGQIYLLSPVDYESVPLYSLIVIAEDQGQNKRDSQVQVTVEIVNYNDLAPQFGLPSYRTSLQENQLQFLTPLQVLATDEEDGGNAVTYRIIDGQSPNNAFVIDRNTGVLSLRATVDYDDTKIVDGKRSGYFELIVEASDNGNPPMTNTVPVIITVIDENNHSPQLEKSVYTAEISELAPPGTFIAQVKGTDADGGDFGKISYRIGSGSFNNFFVDQDTGNVTVNNPRLFDYSVRSIYNMTIIASDGGAPQLEATAQVIVRLIDSNNKVPTFDRLINTAKVNEEVAVDTTVLSLVASDEDVTAKLRFRILGDTIIARDTRGNILDSSVQYDYQNAFGIRPDTGVIYVKSKLDRDLAEEVSFKVIVEDENAETSGQTAETAVTITITGQPKSDITFDPYPSTRYMNEEVNVGQTIFQLRAKDPLSTNEIVKAYELTQGATYFNIREEDGVAQVLLSKKIDYEKDPNAISVTVRATSEDRQRSAFATVNINVRDSNDNPPVFSQPEYFVQLDETATYPQSVISVLATDADSSSFGPIEYSLSGSGSTDFQVFPETVGASILVARGVELDYNYRSVYNLEIVAEDNPPKGDATPSQRLSSRANLQIQILNKNNHDPQFIDSIREKAVSETASIGYAVLTVQATDRDATNDITQINNERVSYSLRAVNEENSDTGLSLFRISRFSGTITVASSLLGMGNRKYPMDVYAEDWGEPARYGKMRVVIEVLSTEDDDGTPKWMSPSNRYVVYAPEETYPYVITNADGQSVFFSVKPRTGTTITYALYQGTAFADRLSINKTTGALTIIGLLDREVQESYNLLVYAEDTEDPINLRTGREIILKLTDKNDNSASFYNPNAACGPQLDRPQIVTVRENTPVNVTVYQLRACDPDGPRYNAITYSFYDDPDDDYCRKGNDASALALTSDGQLVTKWVIDFEQNKEFTMCVKATSDIPVDGNNKRRRKKREFDSSKIDFSEPSIAYLHIVIVDENDNGPQFYSPVDVAAMSVKHRKDKPVHTLRAFDPDGSGFNAITYIVDSIVFYPMGGSQPRSTNGAFKLSQRVPHITQNLDSYEEFSGGHFVMRVSARDSNDFSLVARQRVMIYVYEEGEAIKVTLDLDPAVGYAVADDLIEDLDGVSDRYDFTLIQTNYHSNKNDVNLERTDVCFLAVDTESTTILNVRDVSNLFSKKEYKDILSETKYSKVGTGRCFPSESSEENVKWKDLWWVLVVVGIFIFICCIILIATVWVLYNRYKRYMKTRKTYLVPQ